MPQSRLDYRRIFAFCHQVRAKTVTEDVETEAFDLVAIQIERPTLVVERDHPRLESSGAQVILGAGNIYGEAWVRWRESICVKLLRSETEFELVEECRCCQLSTRIFQTQIWGDSDDEVGAIRKPTALRALEV